MKPFFFKIKNQILTFSSCSKLCFKLKMASETFTITCAEAGENHQGMELIGKIGEVGSGWKLENLEKAKAAFEAEGKTAILYNINEKTGCIGEHFEPAYILVVRNALSKDEADALKTELKATKWDTQYWDTRRQKVLNKRARKNVMWSNYDQKADYENGKGTVVSYKNAPNVHKVRNLIGLHIGDDPNSLICEGNFYHESKSGIGYHGDTERRKVGAIRIGNSNLLCYQWFFKHKPLGSRFAITLNHGDLYYMSEKAVGCDWKRSSIPTLRHAAGSDKYTVYKKR